MTEVNMIKKPYEITPPKLVKMLIYGPPGLGKSTLGLSGPAPLLFDFDGGIHRVKAKHWKDTVQVREWLDVVNVLNGKFGDLSDHKTFVLDTVSRLLDFMSSYIIKQNARGDVKKDGNLTLSGYGTRKSMFQQFVTRVGTMDKHLIFLAQEDEKDQDEIRPKAGGSSGPDLLEQLDLVGHMEAKGSGRVISFEPNEKYYGKNSCGLPSEMELPDPDMGPNNFLMGVFEKYQENANASIEIAKEYNLLMEVIGNDIDDIHDAEEANSFVAKIDGYQHIWDSKLQSSKAMKRKSGDLNLVFDKENGCYVDPTGDVNERDKGLDKKNSKLKPSDKKETSQKQLQSQFDKLLKACKKKWDKDTMNAVDKFWTENESIRTDKNADKLLDLQNDNSLKAGEK